MTHGEINQKPIIRRSQRGPPAQQRGPANNVQHGNNVQHSNVYPKNTPMGENTGGGGSINQINYYNVIPNKKGYDIKKGVKACKEEKNQPNGNNKIKAVYCNVNGMSKKTNDYFETLLRNKHIDILAICEHKKNRKQDLPTFNNYDRWASCRESENGGGTAI